ncbi:hypothetical protein, partial [Sansalvadorimonas verongulae]|uniref:hypothetical protein n=1 Tax=Sansalvadorimonas verongulae TaxID=2172824 RepID=UPI001E38D117
MFQTLLCFLLIAALYSLAYSSSEGEIRSKYTQSVNEEEHEGYDRQPEPLPVYSEAAGAEYLEVDSHKYRVQFMGDIPVSTSSEYRGHQFSDITYGDIGSPADLPPGSYFKTRVTFSVVGHDWSHQGRYTIDIWLFPNGLPGKHYQSKILAVPHNLLKIDDHEPPTAGPCHISTIRPEEIKVYSFASILSLEAPFSKTHKTIAKKFFLTSQPKQILELGSFHDWRTFTDQFNQVTLRLTTSQETLLKQDNAVTSEYGHQYSFSVPRSHFDTNYNPKGEAKLGNHSPIQTPGIQFNDIIIRLEIHVVRGKIAARVKSIFSYRSLKASLEKATSETVVTASGSQRERITKSMRGISSRALYEFLANHDISVYWIDPEHQQHKIARFGKWAGKLEVYGEHTETFYHSGN